jgi:hypothetical protein
VRSMAVLSTAAESFARVVCTRKTLSLLTRHHHPRANIGVPIGSLSCDPTLSFPHLILGQTPRRSAIGRKRSVAVPRAATPPRRGAAYGAILSLRATQAALFEIVRPAEFVMNWKTYFLLTGIIFALVALARALRRSRAAWRRERSLRERCCEA